MNRRPCGTCGFRFPHSHAAVPNRVAAAARALGFLLLLALLLVAIQAHAQGLGSPIGDPCAPGYDADAGVPLLTAALPDGGVEDVPAAICAGQRAPAHGVFLTVKQASVLKGEMAGLHAENKSLQDAVKAQPAIPPKAWFLGCILGTAVTVYCALHDCNPLHIGKK